MTQPPSSPRDTQTSQDLLQKQLQIAVKSHQAGQLEQAKLIYEKLLEQAPGSGQIWYLLGVLYAGGQNFKKSIEVLQHALSLPLTSEQQAYAHYYIGDCETQLGNGETARAYFEKALILRPRFSEAACAIAGALRIAGETQTARAFCEKWLEAGDDSKVRTELGHLAMQSGDHSAAIECYHRALETNNAEHEAFSNLGLSLLGVMLEEEKG